MAFGDLLEQVGSTGRFQVLHVTLLCMPILMMASHNLLQNFVASVPPHHCSVHRNLSLSSLSPEQVLLLTVPQDIKNSRPARCLRYAAPQWQLLSENGTYSPKVKRDSSNDTEDLLDAELQGCKDGWEYSMTEMSSTIISEWDLVCDLRSFKQMGQTIYMGGVLVGAVIFGGLSDRFGRRFLLLISNLLMAVGGTCAAFSTSFSVFCLFRFITGMALSGLGLNSFSLIVEWIPTRVRTVVGTGTGYCYTMGQLILAVVAYFIRDWRWLTLAVSVPFYITFLYSWWFLESARWLVLNRKSEQAVKNLKTVARINGRREEGDRINLEMLQDSMKKEMSCSQGSYSVVDLLRTPTMRNITICLSAVWFSTSFAYYGLSMDLQKFGVDIYLIQVIFGAVDIPAKVVVTVSMSIFGRRPSQCAALILSGVTILINILVPNEMQTVRTTLAVLGKGCLAASFNCCYLYSGELYPTIIRQNGMGWVSMMARVGAMVAPMVLLLGEAVPWLPGFIYGVAPILSGVVAIYLPETLGAPLPDTIQDVDERSCKKTILNASPKKEELDMLDTHNTLFKEAA
ncbi:solute carrier family 22 member 6 isoform X1 [Oncorhynchus mykiss]|uniref:Solute carrier family 22 member 6 n=2 Tax=Oncorhynchus mykiss TaxID=8022 RepID=A0A8C7RUS1_ONCMY|nr:solute carrier family 22 member 6 isoform X1 [Oncorhynchus mykiss]XP_021447137.2 solute carrier family 22 member 6 isoform X1 [Oncorhynchus mykiss]